MKKNTIIPLLLMAATLLSCATKKQQTTGSISAEQPQSATESTYTHQSKEASTPFWSTLFTQVCKESNSENICISPLSAQFALSMTANGATGETQEQMYSTMRLSGDINTAAKNTIESLSGSHHDCEVNIANSIWINEKLNVRKEFIETNKEYFNALVTTAPFNNETLKAINNWCSDNTKGKIKSALDKIKKNDRMYLINALYFKGGWKNEFNAAKTKEQPFTTEDGSIVNVPMMNQSLKTQYYEDSKIQVATMHFDSRYQMQLLLPAEGVTIEAATEHFANNYEKILGSMTTYQLTLSMPRFSCEYGASLKDPLKKAGITHAFSKEAQFDGISDEPLYIDDIFQKTFIKVDEKGAEAAALTVARAGLLSMNRQYESRTMNLNKPFIYLITNYQPQNILFIGKVGNPAPKE